MTDEKLSGSFYTPFELIDFMINYLNENEQHFFTNVLEPSAGDGRFFSRLLKVSESVDGIELFHNKVDDINKKYQSNKLHMKEYNFIDYVTDSEKKYSLIIGNPPYINLKNMDKNDIQNARLICEQEKLEKSVMQNLWVAFLLGATKLLEENGCIFFVLPMELLQVQYAEKLRMYLENKYNTIHIISFMEPIFADIEQQVCLLYLTNSIHGEKHIYYKIYQNCFSKTPIKINLIKKNKPLKKWSNAILSDDEITLLKEKGALFKKIIDLGQIAPGIVTGGNKYFILPKEKVDELDCSDYVIPIVQKSSFIHTNSLEITDETLNNIENDKKPLYLLNLSNNTNKLPGKLREYLEWSGNQYVGQKKLKESFKCSSRNPWFSVPIVNRGQIVFFKRYDVIPRIYINTANVHTTDAGYHIRLTDEYDKESVVFCFFNSITLAECEYDGRYYGGGVCELVPSEFKNLSLPYQSIEKTEIEKLKKMFKEGEDFNKIVQFVNQKTIGKFLTNDEILLLENIRKKLIQRRKRNYI